MPGVPQNGARELCISPNFQNEAVRHNSMTVGVIQPKQMRFRISTLLLLIAVIAAAIFALQRMNSPPTHVQMVIQHLVDMQMPCSSDDFDEHIAKCETPVVARQGNESMVLWRILDHATPVSGSGEQQKPGDFAYGMLTEYEINPQSKEQLVVAVRVYRSELKMGDAPIEKILFSWKSEPE